MPAPNPLLCDHPPSPEDLKTDLKGKLAVYRQHMGFYPGAIPEYMVAFAARACRRTLYAEDLIDAIRRCNSLDEVQSLLDTSLYP
jgi:hypothetical protein